jgi:hypothetical protein
MVRGHCVLPDGGHQAGTAAATDGEWAAGATGFTKRADRRFWLCDRTSGTRRRARPEVPILASRGVSDRCPPCGVASEAISGGGDPGVGIA